MQFLKNKLAVTLVFLLTVVVVVLNKNSTQLIGINYFVTEYEIPIYLKLYNFYGRHLNYDYLVSEITKHSDNDQDKVINISKWVNNNIKKLPKDVEIIDSHPLTIVERRLGTKGQLSDLLSVLLVHADFDSFVWSDTHDNDNILTFYKVDGQWFVMDPYYGLLFANNKNELSSIGELKAGGWKVVTLDFKNIDLQDIKNIFNNKFDKLSQIKAYYNKQFYKIPTQQMIDNTNVFELGGRAYLQSPLNRLKSILYYHNVEYGV